MADYTIANLQFREVVRDSENYLAEASIDIRGDFAVMVYGRYRGMVHSDDGDILCVTSRDGGATWDETPAVVMARFPRWGFTSPGVKILADGSLLAIAHANERGQPGGFVFYGAYSARSTDGGQTWSAPEPLLAWPMRGINIWDNPLELDDGTLLLAVSGAIEDANFGSSAYETSRAALLASTDAGAHWYCHGTIAYDPAHIHIFHEPGLAKTDDGRLVALMRQHYPKVEDAPPGGYLFFAESDDGGASWSPFRKTGLWGYPADLVTMHNGAILAIYGHRRDPIGIRIAVSPDGRTWQPAQERELLHAPLQGVSSESLDTGYRHIGYPSAAVRDVGTILAVFHVFSEQRKQIVLLASFTIAQG